jgi:hypothetical protein
MTRYKERLRREVGRGEDRERERGTTVVKVG